MHYTDYSINCHSTVYILWLYLIITVFTLYSLILHYVLKLWFIKMSHCYVKNCTLLIIITNSLLVICLIYFPGGPMIATITGLNRSLHVGIFNYLIIFIYHFGTCTLLLLNVVCWQNKINLNLHVGKNKQTGPWGWKVNIANSYKMFI